MALLLIFLLGIANFAMHRAVLESGHDIVQVMSGEGSIFTPRITIAIEFFLLLISMLLVGNGHAGWGMAYGIYTIFNGFAAWAVLTNRI